MSRINREWLSDELQAGLTGLEYNVAGLTGQVGRNTSDVSGLTGRVFTLEKQVLGYSGAITKHSIGETGAHIGATGVKSFNLIGFDDASLPTIDSNIGIKQGQTGILTYPVLGSTPTGLSAGDAWFQFGETGGSGATGLMYRFFDGVSIVNIAQEITYGDVFPASTAARAVLFFNTTLEKLFLWVPDAEAWVQIGPGGPAGATGFQGATGILGQTGPLGITGLQGDTGVRGFTGDQGYTGASGETGVQGPEGPTGFIGPTGPQGVTGLDGAAVAIGNTGVQGEPGIQGATGILGATGLRGDTGPRGQTGRDGLQGSTGVRGITGLVGSTGTYYRHIGETGLQVNVNGLLGVTGISTFNGVSTRSRSVSNTIIDVTYDDYAIVATNNTAAALVQINLPSAAGRKGAWFSIKVPASRTSPASFTVSAASLEFIDELPTKTLLPGEGILIQSDGISTWWIFAKV